MLLSIGMIVKNEEKYLDKCLTALKPILDNLDSELIIADTGSTDNTIEIAKKYTKHIYNFKWCDDFSAARNFTLKKSKGKWFMYVDADEILEKSEELINLLKSSDCNKYNSILYKINNIKQNDNTVSYPSRVFKIHKDTKFIGIIHENIPIKEPLIVLENTVFNHYGYLENDFINTQNKMDRNLKLLLKIFNNNTDIIRSSIHISDCYLILHDYIKAINYLYIGLNKAYESKEYNYICVLYSYICKIYLNNRNYDKVIHEINSFLDIKDKKRTTDIDIYYMLCLTYYYKSNYNLCIKYYNKYTKLLKEFNTQKLYTKDYYINPIRSNTNYNRQTIDSFAIISYLKLNQINIAKEIVENKLLNSEDFNVKMKIRALVYFYITTNNYPNVLLLFSKHNNTVYIEIENYLKNNITEIKNLTSNIIDTFTINKNYTNLNTSIHFQILLLKYYYFYNYNNKAKNLLLSILENNKNDIDKNILFFILVYNINIHKYTNNIDIDNMKKLLKDIKNTYGSIYNYIEQYNFENNSIQEIYFNINLIEFGLENINSSNTNAIIVLYNKYIYYNKIYFNTLFNKDILNINIINIMPNNLQLRFYNILAMEQYNLNNYSNCIRYLKHALQINDNFIHIISIISDNILKNTSNQTDEFNNLAKKIKITIQQLIKENKIQEAKNILKEYKKLNPNDKDILNLNKKLY